MANAVLLVEDMRQILVVEDEDAIRQLIVLHLMREGHSVHAVASAEEAFECLNEKRYDLVVLDWMLPGASGVELIRRVRSSADFHHLSILMVTALSEPSAIVDGLEAGADDFLPKPFDPRVFLARVRAVLRRSQRASDTESEIKIGKLSLSSETFEAKCADEQLQLTVSEFKLLLALVNNRGRVLTRDSLIHQIQGEGVSVVGRTVDTHVFGLRKKLGACSEVIETVRGVGYRVRPENEC